MRTWLRNCAIGSAFGALIACTQPGDELVRPAGAPGYEDSGVPQDPAVPMVPSSPLKEDCAQLPTQLERDTCINRKESTV